MNKHNYILTIAGHDPSGGAGITSDIKTFEAYGLYGVSVCTAITVQNEQNFKECKWVAKETILSQIEILFDLYEIETVKIGLVQSWEILSIILEKLHDLNPKITIVLDPIFEASSGFDFHSNEEQGLLDTICKSCFLITPNYDEIIKIYPHKNSKETQKHLSNFTNIYLKGGHRKDKKGWDELYYNGTLITSIPPSTRNIYEKHGSGCVLSAALASNIALGIPFKDACIRSKKYIEQFLNSHPSLLGKHLKVML